MIAAMQICCVEGVPDPDYRSRRPLPQPIRGADLVKGFDRSMTRRRFIFRASLGWTPTLFTRNTLRSACASKCFRCLAVIVVGLNFAWSAPRAVGQSLTGNLNAHDPSTVIHLNGKYYFFYTGTGVLSKTSTNRTNWTNGPSVFATAPSWIATAVPGNTNRNYWAPDVAFFNNQYHLYYSVSTFGSQDSAIGLATNPTLDPAAPNYQWTDRGPVIQSNPGQDPYNTIDPAIIQTSTGDIWMAFGSFWNGIYLTQLDP